MATLTKALLLSELPSGTKKTVVVAGKKIAVANVDGVIFAVDDTCSHEQCSLGSEGFLDGNVIICGCHGAQFDVTTGKVLALPAVSDIASYPTKIEGDQIFIAV